MPSNLHKELLKIIDEIINRIATTNFYYISNSWDIKNFSGNHRKYSIHNFIQIGVKGDEKICCPDCHYEIRVENNSEIYVMIHFEGKKYKSNRQLVDCLENKCKLRKPSFIKTDEDWLWYYRDGSEIQIKDNLGEFRFNDDVAKDSVEELEKLHKVIGDNHVLLSILW